MQRAKTSWTLIAVMGVSMISAFMGMAAVAGPACASEVDILIEKLAQKGLLTRLEAETMRGDIEMAEKASYVQHRSETNPWLADLSAKGDVRLRYEAFNREAGDVDDRNRYRFRVRYGLEKKFGDEFKAGFRLASGTGTNEATSTNQTIGTEFGLKSVFFDQAYGIWTPTARVKEFLPNTLLTEVGAGKVANPYEKWGTSIIWDGDVTPEGIYEKWDYKLMDIGDEGSWQLNLLTGQWVLVETGSVSGTSGVGDVNMMSYGVGTDYIWAKDQNVTFKFTYYDWADYNNYLTNTGSSLASTFGGNDRSGSDFRVLNYYLETNFPVATQWGSPNLKLYGDYAHNSGAEYLDDDARTDETLRNVIHRANTDDAFSLGFMIGKPKVKGDSMFNYEYLYIEANAVPGNFSESDLGLGGANNQGHKIAYKYMLTDALELNLAAWVVDKIDQTIASYQTTDNNPNGDNQHLLRTQVDMVYKF